MVKTNVGPQMPTLAYRLAQIPVGEDDRDGQLIIASYVVWDHDPVDVTAEQAFTASAGKRTDSGPTAKDDCIDFLKIALADGPQLVRDLEAEACDAGLLPIGQPISQCKPMRAARDALEVKVYQQKGQKAGGWFWAMPDQMPSEVSDALQNKRASDGMEGI
jgi:hypothetical protein